MSNSFHPGSPLAQTHERRASATTTVPSACLITSSLELSGLSSSSVPDVALETSVSGQPSLDVAPRASTTWMTDSKSPQAPEPLNLMKLALTVVQSRKGSVLSRGYLIKKDYQPTIDASSDSRVELKERSDQIHLTGASNFRGIEQYGVYGCAQPTETGVRTVLSHLRSQTTSSGMSGRHVVWFSTREEPLIYLGAQPFVLRDASHPTRTYSITNRAENLEEIEKRLKNDILKEAQRYGGLILVQEEIRPDEIVNTWVAADSVRTVREVYEEVAERGGYNLTYHRTPVSSDQSPEDGYLDTYSELIRKVPTSSLLVFNCGIGVVRTTFAMCVAILVRRVQMLNQGPHVGTTPSMASPAEEYGIDSAHQSGARGSGKADQLMKETRAQAERDMSLLRLMTVLRKSLSMKTQGSELAVLLAQPQLLENLRMALVGQYDLILSLLSVIDDGLRTKQMVDSTIDQCDVMVNLRDSILQNRVRAATALNSSEDYRTKALAALERYFFLITFRSFVEKSFRSSERSASMTIRFSDWLKERGEVRKMLSRLRKSAQGHVWVFSPVNDLSAITRGEAGQLAIADHGIMRRLAEAQRKGNEIIGDEWATQIVRSRTGIILRPSMILKNDQWRIAETSDDSSIRGAINFRRVPLSSLFGLSQPSHEGIRRVLEEVRHGLDPRAAVAWINLREEPICYINGTPYVLRQDAVSLRNVKSYSGISPSRLELLEDRLKSDILSEVKAFDGKLLIHAEGADGSVYPVWESVEEPNKAVQTLREIFTQLSNDLSLVGPQFFFKRVPITAERSPNFEDVKEIVELVAQLPQDGSAIIVNCQLGRGRSTRAQIIIRLVQSWLSHRETGLNYSQVKSSRYSYTVINNLLRTIRNGQEVKACVDKAITECSHPVDLLKSIEEARQNAEAAKDNNGLRQKFIERGLQNLRSYYFLILFSSYLHESKAETSRELSAAYEPWVRERPVFKTIEKELDDAGIEALVPLEKPSSEIETGNALADEVSEYVAQRSGRILSAFTLLKSDFFPGLQKMSLPDRVDGAPNFRRVRLSFTNDATKSDASVYGSGMPTIDGLRRALDKMDARARTIVWTCAREEPVLYVSGGRPHVLRLFNEPLENVITTGVTAATVESMEEALQEDLRNEAKLNNGKVLLHDETVQNGTFDVTAVWEKVESADILTPQEVFAMMRHEGYQVLYERLPVTDEQAPLAGVYTRLEERTTQALRQGAVLVFNCQMGRGRTTTGMVAATLVYNIIFDGVRSSTDLSASLTTESVHDLAMPWDGRETDPYQGGEYKIVLKLVSLLKYGKLAKRLADQAIDACEAVQNLREAVLQFKLRAETADYGTRKYSKIFSVAVNYLYRYASLIVFANYLLEKSLADDSEATSMSPFKDWLAERREISSVLSQRSLD